MATPPRRGAKARAPAAAAAAASAKLKPTAPAAAALATNLKPRATAPPAAAPPRLGAAFGVVKTVGKGAPPVCAFCQQRIFPGLPASGGAACFPADFSYLYGRLQLHFACQLEELEAQIAIAESKLLSLLPPGGDISGLPEEDLLRLAAPTARLERSGYSCVACDRSFKCPEFVRMANNDVHVDCAVDQLQRRLIQLRVRMLKLKFLVIGDPYHPGQLPFPASPPYTELALVQVHKGTCDACGASKSAAFGADILTIFSGQRWHVSCRMHDLTWQLSEIEFVTEKLATYSPEERPVDPPPAPLAGGPIAPLGGKWAVPLARFQAKTGNSVTLYHDAADSLDGVNCFAAMHDCFVAARRNILILGWDFDHRIRLKPGSQPLGDLLRQCAIANKVNVCIIIWRPVQRNVPPLVHSHAAKRFFKANPASGLQFHHTRRSPMKAYYSYHQKLVLCDTGDPAVTRVVAFIGGLDLTAGRADTPNHPILSDMSNPYFAEAFGSTASRGPRQPWHDIHARVSGPIVADLLHNFGQRAIMAGAPVPAIADSPAVGADMDWNTQMFRTGEYGPIMESVDVAYHAMIDRADKFIYIENQYLISNFPNCGPRPHKISNQVGIHIAQKIASKIAMDEVFMAYIVLPMWPEASGGPLDPYTQDILYLTWRTIAHMVHIIQTALALVKAGSTLSGKRAFDFIGFYSLAKREPAVPCSLVGVAERQLKLLTSKRYQIYVHSKMAIADDEYILLGSANLNERSLNCERDYEICIGAWQSGGGERVKEFRQRLWEEHLGSAIAAHLQKDPGSFDVKSKVDSLAMANSNVLHGALNLPLPHNHLVHYTTLSASNTVPLPTDYFDTAGTTKWTNFGRPLSSASVVLRVTE